MKNFSILIVLMIFSASGSILIGSSIRNLTGNVISPTNIKVDQFCDFVNISWANQGQLVNYELSIIEGNNRIRNRTNSTSYILKTKRGSKYYAKIIAYEKSAQWSGRSQDVPLIIGSCKDYCTENLFSSYGVLNGIFYNNTPYCQNNKSLIGFTCKGAVGINCEFGCKSNKCMQKAISNVNNLNITRIPGTFNCSAAKIFLSVGEMLIWSANAPYINLTTKKLNLNARFLGSKKADTTSLIIPSTIISQSQKIYVQTYGKNGYSNYAELSCE